MNAKQMAKRIEDMEYLIVTILAHTTNIAHHKACIENAVRNFFGQDKFNELRNSPGKNPMYAEDIYTMLKEKFEPNPPTVS